MMATDPLDVRGLEHAAGARTWTGMPPGTVIGHVHLHVGDLAIASDFFGEALGLDTTVWDYPGALFFAARGYHHHLGTNIWAGPDAQPPTEEDAQLLEWTIELPEPTSLGPLADSLARAGRPVEPIDGAGTEPTLVTQDPWGTRLRWRVGIRALQPGPAQADAWIKQNRIYPYAMPEINAYAVASRHRFSAWSCSD